MQRFTCPPIQPLSLAHPAAKDLQLSMALTHGTGRCATDFSFHLPSLQSQAVAEAQLCTFSYVIMPLVYDSLENDAWISTRRYGPALRSVTPAGQISCDSCVGRQTSGIQNIQSSQRLAGATAAVGNSHERLLPRSF